LSEKKQYRTWTVAQKLEIVLAGLRGEVSVAEVCREHQISETLFYTWREKLLEGGAERLSGKEERTEAMELVEFPLSVGHYIETWRQGDARLSWSTIEAHVKLLERTHGGQNRTLLSRVCADVCADGDAHRHKRTAPDSDRYPKTRLFAALFQWRDSESNRGHYDFQSYALPTELSRRDP
jgi:transposase